jgi:MFS family permease
MATFLSSHASFVQPDTILSGTSLRFSNAMLNAAEAVRCSNERENDTFLPPQSWASLTSHCRDTKTLDRGFSLSFASIFFSMLNFSAFVAKLIGGHLGDRYDRFRVAMATSGLTGLGVSLLFWGGSLNDRNVPRLTSSPLALVAFAVTFGFGYGATFNCLYALVPIIFGLKNLGRTQSSLFGIGLIGNALGSIATGVLRSRYGTYDRAFLVAGITTWTNMIVFAVTKYFVAGTIEKSEETAAARLQHEYDQAGGRYGIDQIDRMPSMLRSGSSIGEFKSPTSPGFFGAVFQESPSTDSLLNFGSPSAEFSRIPSLPGIDADFQLGPAASSSHGDYALRHQHDSNFEPSSARLSGGVEFDSGFAYPRTWSSGSLLRIKENKRRRRERSQSPLPIPGDTDPDLPHSTTLENLLQSGIMSSSFEDIGYVGSSSSMRRNVTTPNVIELGLSRYGASSKSHGSLASDTGQNPGIRESHESARSKSASGTGRGLPPRRGADGSRHPRARETET